MRLAALLLLLTVTAGAKDRAWQTAKLLDLDTQVSSRPSQIIGSTVINARHHSSRFTILISDMEYVALLDHKADTASFIVGDPVSVALEGKRLYLKMPSGKELRMEILERRHH